MALIAPGCARFTLSGTYQTNFTWANIWDARILADVEADRAQICLEYAGWLLQTWEATLGTEVSSTVVATQCSWVDLNDDEGSTGFTTTGLTESGPFDGAITGDSDPANVAVLLSKQVTAARGRRNGRMYVPGLPYLGSNGGDLSSAALALWNGVAADFLTDVTDPPLITTASILPVVIHTRNDGTPTNPDIVYVGNDVIQTLAPQPRLATQRRRLRR